MEIIKLIKEELQQNGGKLSPEFVDNIINSENTKITHQQITKNTRVCVITLPTGHDLVGYAQVLDSKNDIKEIGEQVAYQNAANNIWSVLGSIALAVR